MLDNESVERMEFDKRLAQEEVWIRKGVKARRVRNEGRVKALERMREEKMAQRQVIGQVNMKAQEAERSGHLVAKVEHLGFSYGDKCLIRDFSTQISRGDKIGIIGLNGSGKTTLIRILLGKMPPQQGTVKLGTNLEIAYSDQLREQLDGDGTVIENVGGGADTIMINGKPRNIMGYLQDFLFSPERARTPVKILSGGERNRLFLAKLFTKPSNILVLDEPTNDLDVETLELLEELLAEYSGTILLVSHDRAFLNNVVTSTIVLEGDGVINEFVGGYDDWISQTKGVLKNTQPTEKVSNKEEVQPTQTKRRKLSFKEEKELAAITAQIEKLEIEREEIFTMMADNSFFQKDPAQITKTKARVESIEDELLQAFQRWEELESIKLVD
jgi:ATP-binding cassette subfamily F protein uup